MNHYQQLARARRARRFSTGDGVLVIEGPHKGRKGWVAACGSWSASRENSEWQFHVCFTDDRSGQAASASVSNSALQSDPSGNRGKYGGPSRGGSPEGWRGTSRYRIHGRRR